MQGTYAIALVDGNVVGVAMHNWQGGIFLQASSHAAELARVAIEHTNRSLIALLGPWSQVQTAHIGLGCRPVQRQSRRILFALNLSDLLFPPPATETFTCRLADRKDLDFLLGWRFQYERESTHLPDTDATREFAAQAIVGHIDRAEAILLEVDGAPCSLCTINARFAEIGPDRGRLDAVGIAGARVWPKRRCRGPEGSRPGRCNARRVVYGKSRRASLL